MERSKRPWTATYRLQLNSSFTFDDVAKVAPYLAQLGVSHVYLSPILQATPGSTHGYDGVDPTRLSCELGGPEAYERACEALERHGLGQLVDIVPNHLGTNDANPWWWDVLRLGVESPYAGHFDLRWHGYPPRVRLPVLGAALADAVNEHALHLQARPGGDVVLRYYESSFPLAPETQPEPARVEALNRHSSALLDIVERQHYQLVPWRTAASEIDYRRFFDINGLVGVRVEDETVFRDTHALVLDLVRRGKIDGLRIDHIDGLRDPGQYLARLHAAAPQARIYVEKIVEADEALPNAWPVDGTTGYDFLVAANRLFVDAATEFELDRIYREFTGESRSYEEIVAEKKRLALLELMGGDVAHLAGLLLAACADAAAWSTSEVEAALCEVLVALPVYRTYVRPSEGVLTQSDRLLLDEAIDRAAETCAGVDPTIFQELRHLLTLRRRGQACDDFVLAFQQLSGPAMAKGAEDTAFYCYNRLVSLNEVGGDPARFGSSLEAFHGFCQQQAERWPRTMLTTATHDTKRGEDARLRIDAISELPQEWYRLALRWRSAHEKYSGGWSPGWAAFPAGPRMPDSNTEYLLYQIVAGAWPIDRDRVWEYMLKASREAKLHTSWTEPSEVYEAALKSFVYGVLNDATFQAECAEFAHMLGNIANVSALTQTLLKLTAPGVPDIYQGTELRQLALVDPDNRRPVDYGLRQRLLRRVKHSTATDVLKDMDAGLPKLWLVSKVLSLRNDRSDLFEGGYTPLYATGYQRDCIVAFGRGTRLIAVGQRLTGRLRNGWGDTRLTLPGGGWRNALTDETVPEGPLAVAELLETFPVALLVREGQA